MSPEGFSIPRIQLPQIGQPDPPAPPRADEGSVRRADDHFERFARFIDGGEGLDGLLDGVQRDTVGSDGRTPDQREAEAEQAHQESVLERNAVAVPKTARRVRGFFDDDEDDDVVDVVSPTEFPETPALTPPAGAPASQHDDSLPDWPARHVLDDGEADAADDFPDPGDPYDPDAGDSEDDGEESPRGDASGVDPTVPRRVLCGTARMAPPTPTIPARSLLIRRRLAPNLEPSAGGFRTSTSGFGFLCVCCTRESPLASS